MMKRKLSKKAIRRRRIVAAIEAVLCTIIVIGMMLGIFELFGFLAEAASRLF